jgi:hypothetical protein
MNKIPARGLTGLNRMYKIKRKVGYRYPATKCRIKHKVHSKRSTLCTDGTICYPVAGVLDEF